MIEPEACPPDARCESLPLDLKIGTQHCVDISDDSTVPALTTPELLGLMKTWQILTERSLTNAGNPPRSFENTSGCFLPLGLWNYPTFWLLNTANSKTGPS